MKHKVKIIYDPDKDSITMSFFFEGIEHACEFPIQPNFKNRMDAESHAHDMAWRSIRALIAIGPKGYEKLIKDPTKKEFWEKIERSPIPLIDVTYA